MPIPVYIGVVIWKGREFDDTFNPGQKKVSATFLPEGRKDSKELHVRVNAGAGTRKAERLLGLRRGEQVVLAYLDRGDKSYHDFVDFNGSPAEMVTFEASTPSRATDLDPNDFR